MQKSITKINPLILPDPQFEMELELKNTGDMSLYTKKG